MGSDSSETKAISIYKSDFLGLPELFILTDKKSNFCGWLMFKHPDGQLVSLADLKPYTDLLNGAHSSSQSDMVSRECQWRYDTEGDCWDSDCGQAWTFIDGGLPQNGVKFCHGCGGKVIESQEQ